MPTFNICASLSVCLLPSLPLPFVCECVYVCVCDRHSLGSRALSITVPLSVFVFTCQTLGRRKWKGVQSVWNLPALSATILRQTWLSQWKEFIHDSFLTVIEAKDEISDMSTTLLFPMAPLSECDSQANGLAFQNSSSATVKLYGI